RLYGFPSSGPKEKDEAGGNWERHLTRLFDAVQEELKLRDREMNKSHPRGAVIVPQFQAGPERELRLRSDPAVLEPLMVIAVKVARVPLRAASQNDGPKGFLAALRAEKPTSQVLALAGVDPSHEPRGSTGAGDDPQLTRLTWSGLERLSLGQPGDDVYTESVQIDLIDDRPTGQGRALGIGADNRLIVLQADGRRTVRQASKVGRGASVLGYVGLGQPAREESFRVATDVHEAWFRVLDTRVDTPQTGAVDLHLGDSKPFLFGDEHRVLVSLGESATWRKAGNLRPGYELWDQPSNKKGQPKDRWTLKGSVPIRDAVRMVELSLSWNEARGQATNVFVLPPGDVDSDNGDTLARGPSVLAEARSVDSGPIAPDQLVETVGPEARKVVAIRADRLSMSASQPSVLAGYFLQGKEDVWREIPWLSSHPARVLGRKPVEVQVAHRLRFEDGGSVVLGPGNWVLVRGTDQKHDVAVEKPVSDLRAGDELVAGVHDHVLTTVRLVEIESVRVPPGESSRFILLRAENLPWVKVGPVLVSVEAQVREDDAAAEGLAATTRLAMQRQDGELQYVAITNLAGNDQGGGGWPAAAVDPTIPELLRVPLIAVVRPRPSTRTVIVETAPVPPGEAESPRSFECAPGQLLLVRRQIDEGEGQAAKKVLAVTAARGLRRGDELVVLGGAKGGDSSWPVVRLTVQFHEPPVTTLVLENLRPRHFEISRGALVNDGIAVVLSVPSEVEGLRGRAPEAPSGDGRNAGTAPGPIINKGRNASAPEDGPIATLRRGATEDAIHFPDDAKMDLEKFGGDLVASFEAAAPHLRAPAVATSPLLRYWEEKFGGQHVRWFHSTSDVASELRIWVEELVRKRKQFLREPRSPALPPILLQEMVLASWLQAAGAPELANLVLGDLMELVIFAGCEPARERDRLGSHLGLALVLYGPGFVRGEKPGRPTEPVSPAAQRLVREWGGDDLLSNGEVVLGALYRKWRKQAESIGTWWPRLWEPFTAADMALDRKGAAAAAQSEFGALVSRQVRALVQELRQEGSTP
ncbi:MAG TPA: hypothetical protein VJY33_07005, partial [Isosphaeraceae bacterium]|nr:hypothetical protein [Isosphaeraceae bacterium]